MQQQRVTQRRGEFERLARTHLDTATGFARRLARDEHEAEDLVQDSYLRAYRSGELAEFGAVPRTRRRT